MLEFKHAKVQRLRRLVGRRSAREEERAFVIEGTKLLREALDADAPIEAVFMAPGAADPAIDRAVDAGLIVFELAAGVIERVADTVTPQPVMAVVGMVDVDFEAVSDRTFVVVCVDVRDPGNAGTVLRSAEAAGAGAVVFCTGSVDLYNPKTVRASAGSLFHVPVVAGGDPMQVLDTIAVWGLHRLGTDASGGVPYDKADLTQPVALVLGNEANGLPAEVHQSLDGLVTIPMVGRTESLNVGMAASILCFETARQRRVAA